MVQSYQPAPSVPTASITVKKNKVKNYDGVVYLQDKQEFEIELFNPTSQTKLARISMNGKPISTAGIVIKPGQRIYLERFIDTPKKFAFETYEVDGSSAEVQGAIRDNGMVTVDFYDEIPPKPTYWNDLNRPYGSEMLRSTFTSSTSFFNSTSGGELKSRSLKSLKETGRVEQGSSSDQNFSPYKGDFNNYITSSVHIKMLPLSEKPLEAQDLATYCTNCGTKNKSGKYKFCPSCGNKF